MEENGRRHRIPGLYEGICQGDQDEIQQGKDAEIPEVQEGDAGAWDEIWIQGPRLQEGKWQEDIWPVYHCDETILENRMENR